MGHDHEPALVRRPALLQVLRKPGHALDVEVVGGLVEEDDVPVVREQCRERDPAALTPAEIVDEGIPGDVSDKPAITSRARASPAHSCSGRSPTTVSATVRPVAN